MKDNDFQKEVYRINKILANERKSLVALILSLVLQLSGYAAVWYFYGWRLMAALILIEWGGNIFQKYK